VHLSQSKLARGATIVMHELWHGGATIVMHELWHGGATIVMHELCKTQMSEDENKTE